MSDFTGLLLPWAGKARGYLAEPRVHNAHYKAHQNTSSTPLEMCVL